MLELCDGTLDDFIRGKMEQLQVEELNWFIQMALGVKHIHSKQLIHRDIKPHNVLISKVGDDVVLKISDFGFCKRTTDSGTFSLTSGIKGTFDYMAPEILSFADNEGVPIERGTWASDVFSLGCVFFQLATKVHPFGKSFTIVINIIKGNPVNQTGKLFNFFNYDSHSTKVNSLFQD